ncbi:hypothetical protein [Streptomyces sp. NPDC058812]
MAGPRKRVPPGVPVLDPYDSLIDKTLWADLDASCVSGLFASVPRG